jgi:hypothetical protein
MRASRGAATFSHWRRPRIILLELRQHRSGASRSMFVAPRAKRTRCSALLVNNSHKSPVPSFLKSSKSLVYSAASLNQQALLAIAYIAHIVRSCRLAVATSTCISNWIEMLDPLSTTAAAVGLAQIAIKLCLDLFGFISKLKEASAELRRVNRELGELTNTIAQIRNLIQTYRESDLLCGKGEVFNTIESGLRNFVEDVTRLKNIVKEPFRRYVTMVNRFGKRFKSVLNEKKILEMSARLVNHKRTLHLALSVISG